MGHSKYGQYLIKIVKEVLMHYQHQLPCKVIQSIDWLLCYIYFIIKVDKYFNKNICVVGAGIGAKTIFEP